MKWQRLHQRHQRLQTPSTGLRHPSLEEGTGKRCSECASTEALAASATEGVSVVMETAQLSVLLGLLSQWMERLGASAVMEADVSENPRDPAVMAVSPPAEMALSLSSVGMGVLVVMTARAVAVSPSTEMALSLSSVGMGVPVVMTAAGAENPRDPAVRASSLPNDTVSLLLVSRC